MTHRPPPQIDTVESELFWWGFTFSISGSCDHHQAQQMWDSLDRLFDLHLQRSILDMRAEWIVGDL